MESSSLNAIPIVAGAHGTLIRNQFDCCGKSCKVGQSNYCGIRREMLRIRLFLPTIHESIF
jgi:hypothetical protein